MPNFKKLLEQKAEENNQKRIEQQRLAQEERILEQEKRVKRKQLLIDKSQEMRDKLREDFHGTQHTYSRADKYQVGDQILWHHQQDVPYIEIHTNMSSLISQPVARVFCEEDSYIIFLLRSSPKIYEEKTCKSLDDLEKLVFEFLSKNTIAV